MQNKRHTLEEIRNEFDREGYTLLSNEYKANYYKLKYICTKGHKHHMTYHMWQSGVRCKECYLIYQKRNKYSDIKKLFEDENYQLLTKEYKSNRQRLEYICPKGHYGSIALYSWKNGRRCNKCAIILRANQKRNSLEKVYDIISNSEYKYLSGKYKNSKSKLIIKCNKAHIYQTTFSDFVVGKRCPMCATINCTGSNSPVWNHSYSKKDRLDLKEYRLYISQLTKYNFKKYNYLINPNKLKNKNLDGYHIDHIYSVMDGFRNNVNAKIISSPINLRMLWWSDNISKYDKSEFTLNQLNNLYKQFNLEININK